MGVLGAVQIDERDRDLAYLSGRAFDPTWRGLLEAWASELFENFPPDEARGFFRQIGVRLGRTNPIPPSGTLAELDGALYAAVSGMGWGYCQLFYEDNVMLILHRAYPGAHDPTMKPAWRSAFAALLEGLYGHWVQSQGGSADLRAYVQEDSVANGFLFKFGY